jgi:two-component system, OmpR family, sensor histidine kinase KdpD
MTAQGKLRIYLGAAPGVGKTYAMLAEGQRRRARGTDVVIGWVEPHGRRLTIAMAQGFERVPARQVGHHGAAFTEMDLDALLARHPQVALVDELAHTNLGPGRHEKRWQDVDELLAAGIDVVTTLNIQHLESLGDVVQQITGVTQHETIPDTVARRAQQIELVDMTPEALRRRMVHGNIYPPDRIDAALTHYFRPGNLTALRELALLWVADRVEDGLQTYRAEHGIAQPWETRERVVVALTGERGDESVIRRAARIAARTPGTDLLAVHVAASDGLAHADHSELRNQRALAESLGGSYHQIVGEDAAAALLDFARSHGATQMVLGVSRHGRWASLLTAEGVGPSVIRDSGHIDVHLVHHPGAPDARALRLLRAKNSAGLRMYALGIALAALVLPMLTVILLLVRPAATPAGYALGVGVYASAVFLVFAVIRTMTRNAAHAVHTHAEAVAVGALAASVLRGQGDPPALLEQMRESLGLDAVSLLERAPHGEPANAPWYVTASAGEHEPERPEAADLSVPVDDTTVLAVRGHALPSAYLDVLTACAHHIKAVRDRRATGPATGVDARGTSGATLATLRLVIDRDLGPRLATAAAALAAVRDPTAPVSAQSSEALLAAAHEAVRAAAQHVADLADLCRLRAGALDTHLRPVELDEVLAAVLDDLGPGGHSLAISLPDDLSDAIADAAQLTRAITILTAGALRHSPPDRAPQIRVEQPAQRVQIHIIAWGGELDDPIAAEVDAHPAESLARRLAADLVQAMGGTLRGARTPDGAHDTIIELLSATRRAHRSEITGS